MVLRDVTHMPSGVFNLLSTSKLQVAGWRLAGDESMIWLMKGQAKIIFDAVILTPKGAIFAMCLK